MLLAGEGIVKEDSEISQGKVLLLMRNMDACVVAERL